MDNLKYRRQYLIAPPNISCPFQYELILLNEQTFLYAHIDLPVSRHGGGDHFILIIGDIFDYKDPSKDNDAIASDLSGLDLKELIKQSGGYTGRYVLVLVKADEIYFVHDTIAARKVYYGTCKGQVWLASQDNLLAKVMGGDPSIEEELVDYYQSPQYKDLANSNIGNTTRYSGIKQLMPNHYLHLPSGNSFRYWPNEKLNYRNYKEVAREAASMIKGFMNSILLRHKAMVPVTAGKDSRILLASARDHLDRVMFYINRESGMDESHPDLRISQSLCKQLGLEFSIMDIEQVTVDDEFKKQYFENNPHAGTDFLPHICNYYKNYSDRVNIPGNIASAAFEIFNSRHMRAHAYNFARLNGIQDFSIAIEIYKNWVDECKDFPERYNVNLVNLFYWEERLGNWGTQVQMDKDIAQEDINLFNCRDLVSLFLSVRPKYILPPDFRLHKEILRVLWPETLNLPINPGRKTTLMKVFRRIGMLDFLVYLRYSRLFGYK